MTSEPKNRLGSIRERLPRIVALRHAGEALGQQALADALGIEARSLRAKLGADRGISDAELRAASGALDLEAQRLVALSGHLRRLADGEDGA